MKRDINVVFMGTPDFAVPVLEMLINNTNVVLVITQPDKEVGRKKEIKYCPVKEVAIKNDIEVFQPIRIRNDYEVIRKLNPDLIVTCAYGQIIPQELLDIPRLGAVNVHASLLPKYRGAAPIQWVLLNGEEKTGVSLMYMDAGMDTGDTFAQEEYIIKDTDNVGTLHDELSKMGALLLERNLDDIISKNTARVKQDDSMATYAPMIKREDEEIDINDKCKNIINKIRAFNPWPLVYIKIQDAEFKVIEAEYVKKDNTMVGKVIKNKDSLGIEVLDGIIYFKKVKPIGKKEMNIKDYLNGIGNRIKGD